MHNLYLLIMLVSVDLYLNGTYVGSYANICQLRHFFQYAVIRRTIDQRELLQDLLFLIFDWFVKIPPRTSRVTSPDI